MKISESLVVKLSLYPTNKQVGQSFIQNQIIYASNDQLLDGWLVMECDLHGNPSQFITLYNKVYKQYWEMTAEFLQNTDIELVLATILNNPT